MRVPQPDGVRGSLRWIQLLTEHAPGVLTDATRAALGLAPEWTIEWVSPRFNDQWSEYRDSDFLDRLDLARLAPALNAFWPDGGPQWDGLGRSSDGGVVLVEAKAHANELQSSCQASSAASVERIRKSLHSAQHAFGAERGGDWSVAYYQYANRLAHLSFLRDNGVHARMVFVYFVGDSEMNGPQSREGWTPALAAAYGHLGLNRTPLNVCNVFIDVTAAPSLVSV